VNDYYETGWRADVIRQFIPRPTGNLAVYIWRKRGDGTVDWMLPVDPVLTNIRPEETVAEQGPSLQLDDDLARALLDALAAYFGGTSDVRRLHQDLQVERQRVDRFIAFLTARDAP
jgi:hypothetical protein